MWQLVQFKIESGGERLVANGATLPNLSTVGTTLAVSASGFMGMSGALNKHWTRTLKGDSLPY